jgi:uncharacterized protein (DUF1778 family)
VMHYHSSDAPQPKRITGKNSMPTLKPRISITLNLEQLAILDRFAKATETPRATVVSELLTAALPQLAKVSELCELAQAAPKRLLQSLENDLSNATVEVMGGLQKASDDYESMLTKLLGGDDSEKRVPVPSLDAKRPTAAPKKRKPGPSDPHLLTGGSK